MVLADQFTEQASERTHKKRSVLRMNNWQCYHPIHWSTFLHVERGRVGLLGQGRAKGHDGKKHWGRPARKMRQDESLCYMVLTQSIAKQKGKGKSNRQLLEDGTYPSCGLVPMPMEVDDQLLHHNYRLSDFYSVHCPSLQTQVVFTNDISTFVSTCFLFPIVERIDNGDLTIQSTVQN